MAGSEAAYGIRGNPSRDTSAANRFCKSQNNSYLIAYPDCQSDPDEAAARVLARKICTSWRDAASFSGRNGRALNSAPAYRVLQPLNRTNLGTGLD